MCRKVINLLPAFAALLCAALGVLAPAQAHEIARHRGHPQLTISYGPWPGFDIAVYGVEAGVFAENGVDVTLLRMATQSDATRAVLRERVDGAFTSIWDLTISSADTSNLNVVLATNKSHGSDGIVAAPGINTVADLKGKTVGAKLGAINQLILLEALELHGLSPTDITIRDLSTGLDRRELLNHRIDAAVTWEPDLSGIAQSIDGKVIHTTADLNSLVYDVLVATDGSLSDKHEAWDRFLAGWMQIMDELDSNPDQVFEVVGEAIGRDPAGFAKDYAGLVKGDRALNNQLFGRGGEIYDYFKRIKALVAAMDGMQGMSIEPISIDSSHILRCLNDRSEGM